MNRGLARAARVAALALAATLGSAPSSLASTGATPEQELFTAMRDLGASAEIDRVAARLAAIGPSMAPPAVAALAAGSVGDGAAALPLDAPRRALLDRLLDGLDWSDVEASVRAQAHERLSVESASGLLELVGRRGGAADAELLISLTRSVDLDGSASIDPLPAFGLAVTALAGREPETLEALERCWTAAPNELRQPLTRAIANVGRPRGLGLVVRILEWDASTSECALTAIATLARHATDAVRAEVSERVAHHLSSDAESVRAAAAFALGRLGESSTIAELVELLGDSDSHVRHNVHDALRSIAQLDLGAEADPWRAWLRLERRWFQQNAGPLLARIGSAQLSDSLSAIEELSVHPLYATTLAPAMADHLGDRRGRVRERLCHALARLGRDELVPDLERLVDDPVPAVSAAARAAIAELCAAHAASDPDRR